jgi:hypothetical protein
MNIRKMSAAAGAVIMLAAGLGATTAAASAAPAQASRVPVIYGTFGNWQSPRVEPRNQAMGAEFVLVRMRWTRWNGSFAKAGGTDQWADGAAGKVHNWPSTITLYRVRTHGGHRYYSRMTIASHGHHTFRLSYRIPGGWFQS